MPITVSGAQITFNDGTNQSTAMQTVGLAPAYACRAWVNFNGIGTISIRASGNISSITDNGVGDYTINFSTVMPDANYSCVLTTTADGADRRYLAVSKANGRANGSMNFLTATTGNVLVDPDYVAVAVFR